MNAILFVALALAAQADPPANPPAGPQAMLRAKLATHDIPGEYWVGQHVTIVVELLSPSFFASAPAFDLPQVPGAILIKLEERPVLSTEKIVETEYTVQRHEVAVFAQRPGVIKIPPFAVRFESAGVGGKPPTPWTLMTPPLEFAARLPPGADKLQTLITTSELQVEDNWQPSPEKGRVGDAWTRTITFTASDVPGMALPEFHEASIDGLSVYRKPPVVADQNNRGDLLGKRIETLVYVAERPGTFEIPRRTLSWWDLDDTRLRTENLSAVKLEIAADAAAKTPAGDAPREATPRRAVHARRWGALALAAVVLVGLPLLWSRRAALAPEVLAEAAAFSALIAACQRARPAEAYAALLAWLDAALPDSPEPRLEHWVAGVKDPELTASMTALEANLFAQDRPAWPAGAATELARKVRQHRSRSAVAEPRQAPAALAPLNP